MRDREFVPGHPGDVTAAWLARAMRAGNVPGAAHVARVDAEVIGEDRGFTGVVARLTPRYREPVSGAPRTLIGKFPLAERADESTYRQAQGASTELLRRFAERAAREVEFFRFAGSELTQVPVCYFGHADVDAGEVLLLLEDLSAGVPGDALAGCSVEQARSVVNGIQTVHARWWNDDTLASLAWLPGWAGSNADRVERFRDRVETVIERYSDRLSGDIVGLLRGSAGTAATQNSFAVQWQGHQIMRLAETQNHRHVRREKITASIC